MRLPIINGRKFGCTACGNCCFEKGYVFFGFAELAAMAEHLKLSQAEFKDTFDVTWDADSDGWMFDATDGNGCPLLDKKRQCRVHPVKPTQCRTFPFWDELLDRKADWEAAKSFCPGLDAEDGRLFSRAEIQKLRKGEGRT